MVFVTGSTHLLREVVHLIGAAPDRDNVTLGPATNTVRHRSVINVIILKACPRCNGDIDTAFDEDAYCIQCGYRPGVVYPGPFITEGPDYEHVSEGGAPAAPTQATCPKCGTDRWVRLERLRSQDNTCYRCRGCGHIFSPGGHELQQGGDAVLP